MCHTVHSLGGVSAFGALPSTEPSLGDRAGPCVPICVRYTWHAASTLIFLPPTPSSSQSAGAADGSHTLGTWSPHHGPLGVISHTFGLGAWHPPSLSRADVSSVPDTVHTVGVREDLTVPPGRPPHLLRPHPTRPPPLYHTSAD